MEKGVIIDVRVNSNPDRLNPALTLNPIARQINTQLFSGLADFDPETMELTPILAAQVSNGTRISNEAYPDGMRFDFEIRPEAVWDNGAPVTAEDYLFTMKMVKNPFVSAAIWRGFLKSVQSIEIDAQDNKKFSVFLDEIYVFAKEVVSTFEVYPKHIYDPNNLLDGISLNILNDELLLSEFSKKDSTLQQFADQFNANKFSRETVEGSGPYKLESWVADQYVRLVRKENWWGDALNGVGFYNDADEIIYRIIPDNQTAINLLYDKEIDILSSVPAANFEDLKNDSLISEQYNFHSPKVLRYLYLGLNNRLPKLADRDVRRALAHVVDVTQIIQNLENGYGNRTTGFINSASPLYNKSLIPLPYDIKEAKRIFQEEGWVDSNNNGVVDKMINGNLKEMELDIIVSGSQLGQQIALLFQQAAKEAGIQINIDTRDQAGILNAIKTRTFEVIALASGQDVSAPDPYQNWHTENDKPGAGNRFGFGNASSDSIIMMIRQELDPKKQKALYQEFQALIYEEQPVIYLYNPQARIIVNKDFEGIISSKRPGYFPGSFKQVAN